MLGISLGSSGGGDLFRGAFAVEQTHGFHEDFKPPTVLSRTTGLPRSIPIGMSPNTANRWKQTHKFPAWPSGAGLRHTCVRFVAEEGDDLHSALGFHRAAPVLPSFHSLITNAQRMSHLHIRQPHIHALSTQVLANGLWLCYHLPPHSSMNRCLRNSHTDYTVAKSQQSARCL